MSEPLDLIWIWDLLKLLEILLYYCLLFSGCFVDYVVTVFLFIFIVTCFFLMCYCYCYCYCYCCVAVAGRYFIVYRYRMLYYIQEISRNILGPRRPKPHLSCSISTTKSLICCAQPVQAVSSNTSLES